MYLSSCRARFGKTRVNLRILIDPELDGVSDSTSTLGRT